MLMPTNARPSRTPGPAIYRFTGTDAARARWLTDDEARRLVDVCPPDFRTLVTAAILTGIRYGDLTRLTAGDYDANGATYWTYWSTSARPRRPAGCP
jgi:integrase